MLVTFVDNNTVQGPKWEELGWILQVTFTEEEMNLILSQYDPASSTSPSVTVCRPIVREMLDAVLAYTPDGS